MNQSASDDIITSRWVDDIVRVLEKLGGIASFNQINQEIPEIRSQLSSTWRDTIRRTIYEHCSDTDTFRSRGGRKDDLFFSVGGMGSGIWGLRSHVNATPDAVDSDIEPVLPDGEEAPKRAEQKIYRVLRDTELARQLKLLYRDKCQICGTALKLSPGVTYSEAHHIIPLGKHNGPDVPGNILVLCPNHHALCDYGAIRLEIDELTLMPGHEISLESIAFHNQNIFGQVIERNLSQSSTNE